MNLFTDPAVAVRQIQEMLALQEQMNSRVHPEWAGQGFPWYRAIWTESAEMLDHYGWKWWKRQTPDLEQVCLELVDIWHFGLSALIQKNRSPGGLELQIAQQMSSPSYGDNDPWHFAEVLELFVNKTLAQQGFDLPTFCRLLSYVGMDLNELYALYIGKNTLNFFRQDNGYQEGTYQKIWKGKEDNEVLMEILKELDPQLRGFREAVEEGLQKRYIEVLRAAA